MSQTASYTVLQFFERTALLPLDNSNMAMFNKFLYTAKKLTWILFLSSDTAIKETYLYYK